MQILLVEDNRIFGTELVSRLTLVPGVTRVRLERSRTSGAEALREDFYDLVVLDLGLPFADNEPETEIEHGQQLFAAIQTSCPGLPIFVLTGSTTTAWGERLGRFGNSVDLWGSGLATNTVDYFRKEDVAQLFEEVERIATEVHAVDMIGINTQEKHLDLSPGWERAIRIAVRKLGGTSAIVEPLSGGRSRVRVFQITAIRDGGTTIATLAGKLGDLRQVEAEIDAYDRHVQRLPVGAFPHRIEVLKYGLCGKGAIFYRLAEEHRMTLFDLIAADPVRAAEVVEAIRLRVKIWTDARTDRWLKIGDIRRHILWDNEFEDIKAKYSLDVDDIEAMSVDAKFGCTHGDLHGSNVLVAQETRPILIDFGEVAETALCLDPITLELCLIFHPDGHAKSLIEDVTEYFAHWPDASALPGSGVGPYLKACRDWSNEVAGGKRSLLAAAYAYAIRQLRFETVESGLTLRLVSAIVAELRKAG